MKNDHASNGKGGPDGFAVRRRRVHAAALKQGAGLLLVSKFEDVTYLTGFTGDDSWLLVGPGKACLLTDGRYNEQAHAECPGLDIFIRKGAMSAALATVIAQWRAAEMTSRPAGGRPATRAGGATLSRALGLQGESMSLGGRDVIAKALPRFKVLAISDAVGPSRIIKDALEVGIIRQAIKIAQDAFTAMIARGRKGFVGQTEREVAARLDYLMRQAGADKSSFDTIVAAGPHGSLPHYRPGDTPIQAGDPVLIDWGAKYRGYCSDLTRVVFTGTIPPELATAYKATLKAQAAGIKAIKAGATLKSPDDAARAVLSRAGLLEKFVHGLGHGIGLEIHEAPGLGQMAKGRLKAGMVVTAEPGVYLPGVGGIRIEDDILVTKHGSDRLSTLSSRLEDMLLG